jgi:hypothetical protein
MFAIKPREKKYRQCASSRAHRSAAMFVRIRAAVGELSDKFETLDTKHLVTFAQGQNVVLPDIIGHHEEIGPRGAVSLASMPIQPEERHPLTFVTRLWAVAIKILLAALGAPFLIAAQAM